jgi:hypothetical protein
MDGDASTSDARRLQRDDVLMRMQRRVGLAPAHGLGTLRRAVFWALVGWGPIAAWAALTGRADASGGESLIAHFGVTVRLLVAVPLMVIAEAVMARSVVDLARHCAASGLFHVDSARLREVADGLCRLRDRAHPWAVAAGLAVGALLAWQDTAAAVASHALAWAGDDGRAGFGVRWYLWVARPVFLAFVAAWVWRAVLLGIALHRVAHSGMRLVPTHPDRAGGLGFGAPLTVGFGLVAFALSSVVAAGWAHEVAWHDLHVASLRVQMITAVVVLAAIFIAPLAVLIGPMSRVKKRARLQYGALVARHGDALHQRWIEGLQVDEPLLAAPEIGAAADAAVLYEAVCKMRPVPLGPQAVLAVLVPAALPMLAVLAIEVPIGRLLQGLLKALV